MRFDTVIRNGCVVTVNPDFDIIENGMIGIKDGRIARVAAKSDEMEDWTATETIDAGGGLILPGLVNAHTHLPMSLFRGLADDLPLNEWLNRHIFPAEQAHVEPETVRIGALLSCAELLLTGTTTCCDGYFHESEVVGAVMTAGIRAVLGQGVIDFPAPGVPDPDQNIAIAEAFAAEWKDRSPLITPSIFCHSPYTCSQKTLIQAKKAADRQGVRFQIHVAETRNEVDMIDAAKGRSPVRYLDRLGVLDPQTIAVHAVWVDEADIAILSDRGVRVIHNPESNMKLASGIAPVPAMLKAGITVGLGTDGCASNNNLDMFAEMDSAAKLHKAALKDPTVMDADTVLKMATIYGARAIGLEDRIGSIEAGKAADIIIIDTARPHLTPLYHPTSHLVYAVRGADVDTVLVAGEVRVRNGRLAGLDLDDLLQKAKAAGAAIRQTDSIA